MTDSLVLSNLRRQWMILAENWKAIIELQTGTRETLRDLSEGTNEELAGLELEILRLENLLGHCDSKLDMTAAFDNIAMLLEDTAHIEKTEKAMETKGTDWGNQTMQDCVAEAVKEMGKDPTIVAKDLGKELLKQLRVECLHWLSSFQSFHLCLSVLRTCSANNLMSWMQTSK